MEKKTPITTDIETNWTETVQSFDDLNLNENLLRGIYGKIFIKVMVMKNPLLFNKKVQPLFLREETLLLKLNQEWVKLQHFQLQLFN